MATQAEIAEAIGYSQPAIAQFIEETTSITNGESAVSDETPDSDEDDEDDDDRNNLGRVKLTKEQLAHADHAIEFDTPVYNVWKQQKQGDTRATKY